MKFKITLLAILLWSFSPVVGPSGDDAKTILADMRKALADKQSISYTSSYHYKCYNCEDTITFKVQCRLLRDTGDTLYHGMVAFMGTDSVEVMYDKEMIYIRQYKRKKVVIYNPEVYGTTPISTNQHGLAVLEDFLDATTEVNTAKLKFSILPNDTIEKKPYRAVKIEYPNAGDAIEISKIIYIDPQTGLPAGGKYVSKLHGNYQYEFFMLSNINFNTVGPEQFGIANLPKKYKISYYQPYALQTGIDAPQFDGVQVQDKKTFQLSAHKGEAVLVGFWKQGNKPSQAALKYLNEMKTAYGAKNLAVVSVPIGKQNDEKIKADILVGKIKYTPLRPNHAIDSLYRIRALPAFYLVNRSGKISFRSVGYYHQAIKDSLQKAIERALE